MRDLTSSQQLEGGPLALGLHSREELPVLLAVWYLFRLNRLGQAQGGIPIKKTKCGEIHIKFCHLHLFKVHGSVV